MGGGAGEERDYENDDVLTEGRLDLFLPYLFFQESPQITSKGKMFIVFAY